MASVTKSAGTGASDGGAGAAWGTPTNITASDAAKTNCTLSTALGNVGEGLLATQFGFEIAGGARIRGIELLVERACNSQTDDPRDETIQLLKAGSAVGDNKAVATVWPLVDAVATYGASTDLWGTTWSVSEVNDSSFGAIVRPQRTDGAGGRIMAVDHIQITVHYDEPEKPIRHVRRPHLTIPGSQSPFVK